jgi:hypothetical protein
MFVTKDDKFSFTYDAVTIEIFRALLEMLRSEVEAWCNGTNAICVQPAAVAV